VIRGGTARSVIACGGLALLACAGSGPEWLDGSAEAYPNDLYLVGVGSGPGLDAARDRARAEIARSFEVHIEDEVLDRTASTSSPEGSSSARTVVEQIAIETRTTTEVELEGVRIAGLWTDPASQQAYALAVLERRSAGRAFLDEVERRDAEAEGHLAAARVEVDSLARVRALVRAVRASQARDVFAARARVVGASANASDERSRTAELERELLGAISDVRFAVRAREVYLPGGQYRGELAGLRSGIADRLTGMGFRVEEGRGGAGKARTPTARVHCNLGLEPVERGNPDWKHFQWDGSCEVEGSSGVLVSAARSGSESHPNRWTARVKALERGEGALTAAVERDLRAYVYSEDAE
jgi:hypothetical protein